MAGDLKVQDILEKLRVLDVALEVVGDRLRLSPPEVISPELLVAIRAHKPELLAMLREAIQAEANIEESENGTAPSGYLTGDAATAEGTRQLETRGWLPVWSEALGAVVILALRKGTPRGMPAGLPARSLEDVILTNVVHEALEIFGGRLLSPRGVETVGTGER